MKTKAYNTSFTIASQVGKLSKSHLQNACKGYNIILPANSCKEDYVRAVTNYTLEHAKAILSHLTIPDVKLIRDMVNIGPGKGIRVPFGAISYVFKAFYIKAYPDEINGCCWYVMADEIRTVIGTHAEELLVDPEYRERSKLLQFIHGFKTMYGLSYYLNLVFQFVFYNPKYFDNNEVLSDLMSSPIYWSDFAYSRLDSEQGYLMHPYLDAFDEDMLNTMFLKLKKVHPCKYFSKREILAAGKLPFPVFMCKPACDLKTFLCKECNITRIEADSIMFDLWFLTQPFYDQEDRAEDITRQMLTAENEEIMEKLVVLVNDFLNSTPCWAHFGFSVEESSGIAQTK